MGLCDGCIQDDDIPGIVRFRTYEVLKDEVNNPRLRWAYLPYSMHMAGPREAIQHMIIRRNYGERHTGVQKCLWCRSHTALLNKRQQNWSSLSMLAPGSTIIWF